MIINRIDLKHRSKYISYPVPVQNSFNGQRGTFLVPARLAEIQDFHRIYPILFADQAL